MQCFVKFLAGRIASFGHAISGLKYVIQTQRNAQIHLAAAALIGLFGIALGVSRADWLWISLAIALVWFAETLNTAVEYLCDVVSPEHSDAVRRAKDIAAGGVLIMAVLAMIIGYTVFWPHLMGRN